jgi:hypothetical protein
LKAKGVSLGKFFKLGANLLQEIQNNKQTYREGRITANIINEKYLMAVQIKSFEEYRTVYQESIDDPEGFWARQAETFYWRKKWDKVLEWDFQQPDIKWFLGGKMNITDNGNYLGTQRSTGSRKETHLSPALRGGLQNGKRTESQWHR